MARALKNHTRNFHEKMTEVVNKKSKLAWQDEEKLLKF